MQLLERRLTRFNNFSSLQGLEFIYSGVLFILLKPDIVLSFIDHKRCLSVNSLFYYVQLTYLFVSHFLVGGSGGTEILLNSETRLIISVSQMNGQQEIICREK